MRLIRSGRFWMYLWLVEFLGLIIWGVITVLYLLDSIRNVNMLSVAAIYLAGQSGVQQTLTMRKADDKDEF